MQSCREYRDANLALGEDSLKQLCEGQGIGGVHWMSGQGCPTEKVIATCTKPDGKDFMYEGYPVPLADAEKFCTDGSGTFKSGS